MFLQAFECVNYFNHVLESRAAIVLNWQYLIYYKNEPTNEAFSIPTFKCIMLVISKDNVEFDMLKRHLQVEPWPSDGHFLYGVIWKIRKCTGT